MKYSFMSFSCPELALDEMLAVASRFGYDAVELRLDAGHRHGLEVDRGQAFRAEVRKLAAREIPICCLATSCRFSDPGESDQNMRDAIERIDLAGDTGVERIRVFGGPFADSMSREEATQLVASSLGSLVDQAEERGVTICMETHDAWCDPRYVAEVMRQVNHPNVGVNWDIMHPVRTGKATVAESFEELNQWIKHVHFHDGVDEDGGLKLLPIGQGLIDHRKAVQLLSKAGYDGYLSGEWIGWEPWEDHLPRELATMRAYED